MADWLGVDVSDRTCTSPGCERPHYARDLCKPHYNLARRDGTLAKLVPPPLSERVAAKLVATPTGCIEWRGATDPSGYGQIRVGGRRGQLVQVHRLVWEIAHGSIPDGVHIMHRCDNPPCARLSHLIAGDAPTNMADKSDKGRHHNQRKTHCVHGHEFTPENTIPMRTQTGRPGRRCRTCKNLTQSQYDARRRKGTSR